MASARILVCGGRDYNNLDRVYEVMDTIARKWSLKYDPNDNWLPTDLIIIHGGAKGADTLADRWATHNYCIVKEFKADWKSYGKAAGYRRNIQMLTEGKPDLVVAFPGGKGTAMMVDIAKKAGVETLVVDG